MCLGIISVHLPRKCLKLRGIEPPSLTRIPKAACGELLRHFKRRLTLPYRVRHEAPAGLAESAFLSLDITL
jgi:hypothetical protein